MTKSKRWREGILLIAVGIFLFVAASKVFEKEEKPITTFQSQQEEKLEGLLSSIDGVGSVEVMICEDEEGVTGVVIVCSGANDIRVHCNIVEAVATALGTDENNIKIYVKKN